MKLSHPYIAILFVAYFIFPLHSMSQTRFESTNVSEIDTKVKKVMILHLGEIYDNRKILESEITYWLNKYKFDASPSYRYFEQNHVPTKENIKKILKENNFDAILTTAVVTFVSKEKYENPQSAYNLTINSPTFYNYLDTYQNKYSTGYTFQEKTFIVQTNLFRIDDEKTIYKATTQTDQPETMDLAIQDFSKAIAKSLKSNKVLDKKKK